ncbi:class I SAM-dependent methyltransferase [Bradyrhizobium sp. STM 3809]|uniref:class I SAM-dependent methyltransferase n=1 Tax=Bradyrhizobium sp. STM 3809 TaxID=551936 RepID=UPI00111293A3|nr:class I SAM-dependent methyltransferase [Bradyrhizobium sp. STM 3809]
MKLYQLKSHIKSAGRRALHRLFPHATGMKATAAEQDPRIIFSEIYRRKVWGGRLSTGPYSGSGSRDPSIVNPYVEAVRKFLSGLSSPSIVDMGCGDFYVGSQLVACAGRYVGCDVVDFVIAQNKRKHPNIEFVVCDAVTDDLPPGDVVLVRQVLQHLNNRQVAQIVPKLCNYSYAIITEHIPGFSGFIPNLDKAAGPDHRVNFGSGLVLTEPPFNLKADNVRILCEVNEFGGIIQTTLYDKPRL